MWGRGRGAPSGHGSPARLKYRAAGSSSVSGDGSENICVPCGGNREAHDEEQVLLRECHGHDAVQAKLDERCPWRLKKVHPVVHGFRADAKPAI